MVLEYMIIRILKFNFSLSKKSTTSANTGFTHRDYHLLVVRCIIVEEA